MSEAISALNMARFDGLAKITECGLVGMITLRGDLSNRTIKAAAKAASGKAMPGANAMAGTLSGGLAWMSPDEALILCPYSELAQTLAALSDKLGKQHALAVDVSDARAVFRVSGACAREVMAKLCPLDLSPEIFTPGMFRRTRMAQIPAAIWADAAGDFYIICFRSVAQYAFDLLKTAAQPGSNVGYF